MTAETLETLWTWPWWEQAASILTVLATIVGALLWINRTCRRWVRRVLRSTADGARQAWGWIDHKWPARWRVGWRRQRDDELERRLEALETEVMHLRGQADALAFMLSVAYQELGEVSPGHRERLAKWLYGLSLDARLSETERARRNVSARALAKAQLYQWVLDIVTPGHPLVVDRPKDNLTLASWVMELEFVCYHCIDEITKSGDWEVRKRIVDRLLNKAEDNDVDEKSFVRVMAKVLNEGSFMEHLLTRDR